MSASGEPVAVDRYRHWLDGLLGVPVTDGNAVEVLRNGDQIFPAMLDAVRTARCTIDFLTFIYRKGSIGAELGEALAERAAAGVRVRVLLDAMGAGSIDRSVLEELRAAGAHVEWFRPLSNPRVWETTHRGHRKLLICDGTLAFTGGVGIADEWLGDALDPTQWRDTHFRVRGPAVNALRGTFVNNWAETGRPLFDEGLDRFEPQPVAGSTPIQVVRGGARTGWGDIPTLVAVLLSLACHRVRIAAAYFVPDKGTLALLCDTARRGVTVDLLINGAHADKRLSRLASEAQYATLLEAGVRVRCFRPTMLHQKLISVDGAVASVGSANFNSRSLVLDEEVNLVVLDPEVVEILDGHFEADLQRAEHIDPDAWAQRAVTQKALEVVPGFLARHL
jgi:cardiolipin synthase